MILSSFASLEKDRPIRCGHTKNTRDDVTCALEAIKKTYRRCGKMSLHTSGVQFFAYGVSSCYAILVFIVPGGNNNVAQ